VAWNNLNKKGDVGNWISSIGFFLILFIVAGGVVFGYFILFGAEYDFRQAEADIIFAKTKDCLGEHDFFNEDFSFYRDCRFNEQVMEQRLVYVKPSYAPLGRANPLQLSDDGNFWSFGKEMPFTLMGGLISVRDVKSDAPTPASRIIGELEDNTIIKLQKEAYDSSDSTYEDFLDEESKKNLAIFEGQDIRELMGKHFSEIPNELLNAQVGNIGEEDGGIDISDSEASGENLEDISIEELLDKYGVNSEDLYSGTAEHDEPFVDSKGVFVAGVRNYAVLCIIGDEENEVFPRCTTGRIVRGEASYEIITASNRGIMRDTLS
jgi:hypothetical protein